MQHVDSRGTANEEDLEEALLFEFEADESSSLTPKQTMVTSSLLSAAASAGSLGPAGSLPSVLSGVRSVTKDSAGTHVLTENFTLHIEEERATSSNWQMAFNAINVLCGVGLLTTPYAMAITGTSALLLLVLIGAVTCYTAHLLAACMNTSRSIRTYPDIGQAAFGQAGRIFVSVLLYMELFSCCVDFMILEADNLSAVFPDARLSLGAFHLTAKQTLVLLAALLVLPTVWLRDLSLLSFLSVGGIFASVALLALVGWEGTAVTGFTHQHPPFVSWSGVPVTLGLFLFCFSGHAVFPSLYASMRNKSQFPKLMIAAFSVVVVIYGTMAIMGGLMFGSDVSENITLDMQVSSPRAPPTIISMWLVIINPISKLALTLAPVAMAVEELLEIKHHSWKFTLASMTLRTGLLGVVVLTAIAVPFFASVMSFIGSFMATSVAVVLPCLFALKICRHQLSRLDVGVAICMAVFGVVVGVVGTYNAIMNISSKY